MGKDVLDHLTNRVEMNIPSLKTLHNQHLPNVPRTKSNIQQRSNSVGDRNTEKPTQQNPNKRNPQRTVENSPRNHRIAMSTSNTALRRHKRQDASMREFWILFYQERMRICSFISKSFVIKMKPKKTMTKS